MVGVLSAIRLRFLEGWAPAMAPGHSTTIQKRSSRRLESEQHPLALAFPPTGLVVRNGFRMHKLFPKSVASNQSITSPG
jgi:hypothetical protein